MANIIISEQIIKTADIADGVVNNIPADAVKIDGVTRVTAGYNLIYVEYTTPNNKNCVRTFGRKEFESLLIIDDTTFVVLPLNGELFERTTFRFPNENSLAQIVADPE